MAFFQNVVRAAISLWPPVPNWELKLAAVFRKKNHNVKSSAATDFQQSRDAGRPEQLCADSGHVTNFETQLGKFAADHPYIPTARGMDMYAGLTDDPPQRKQDHGNPSDWTVKTFSTEKEARNWEKAMHDSGFKGAGGGAGWKYGYTYTITSTTRQ